MLWNKQKDGGIVPQASIGFCTITTPALFKKPVFANSTQAKKGRDFSAKSQKKGFPTFGTADPGVCRKRGLMGGAISCIFFFGLG
ncbi:MAG: hypothetical protein OXD49_00900, partial [Candidatus Poribacteria bacterium]|nr:hypothetical protein [Candidatus Poribacteria bacterium]